MMAILTALVLGFLHAIELDHMVAVTAFVSRRPALLTAAGFGARWGLGHSVAVLVLGGIALAAGVRIPAGTETAFEALVGIALIVVGTWSLRATRNLHLHAPQEHGDHAHLHLHRKPQPGHAHPHGPHAQHPPHHHPKGIGAVGLIHGLAGTSAAVALVPVTMATGVVPGLVYLGTFGVGVTLGMSLFALVAAVAMRRAADRSIAIGRRIGMGAGWLSVLVGVFWLIGALTR
jgi:nickel/cobalt exporter